MDALSALNRQKYSLYLYFFGLCLIAAGLPLSKFLMSIGQFTIAGAWLLHGAYLQKCKDFLKNKTAWLIASFYLLHLIGLLYTSNFDYAFKDLRIKLPLLIIPFICVTMPALSKDKLKKLFYFFLAAVVFATLASTYKYFNISALKGISNRTISIFISHIRFSLLVCVAIFFSIKYSKGESISWFWRLLAFWLIAYLLFAGMITGIVVLFCIAILSCAYMMVFNAKKQSKFAYLGILLALIVLPTWYVYHNVHEFYSQPEIKKVAVKIKSPDGKKYDNNFSQKRLSRYENGYPVWRNIAWNELKTSWNKKSKLAFDGKDKKGQLLSTTLIRYLTSKGLSKDEEGVKALNKDDITAVENGIANADYIHESLIHKRIQKGIYEVNNYLKGGNYNGHSLILHYIYQKTGLHIFKKHWLIGIGTGDINDAFQAFYNKEHSILKPENRLRSHNQFITFAATFGIFGLIWFLVVLLYPLTLKKYRHNLLYLCFLATAILSMLSEDTLETQAGITFFIFFEAYFLWLSPDRNLEDDGKKAIED